MDKIAIQGVAGSFHHQVAQEYFGRQVQVDECMSFQAVADSLLNHQSTAAVMAIENSIAGSILSNYALIDEHNLQVIGEHYIPIQLNLMALQGQTVQEIRKVYSHPMALLQCKDFFRNHPHIELVEDTDTAEVARRIREKGLRNVAAVASKAAAEIYNLEILEEGIQTIKNNSTRFLTLGAAASKKGIFEVNKASLKFILESKQGSLVSVLNIIRDFDLDMTKIQSVPVIETPWKYAFFIDVIFEDAKKLQKALEIIEVMTEELKVLGTYKNGLK